MIEEPLKLMFEECVEKGLKLPKIVYSDRCCDDAPFFERIFPTLREELINKPPLKFEGDTVVIRTLEDATLCAQQIFDFMSNVPEKVIGVDTEWDFDGHKSSKVAILQVAVPDGPVYIFQLIQMGSIPPTLLNLLSNDSILKVGSYITTDKRHLLDDWEVNLVPIINLGMFCKERGIIERGNVSLKY